MATSSKVMFNLEKLTSKALASVDERLSRAIDRRDRFNDDAAMERLVVEWRKAQEAKISELFRRLGDEGITDHQLSKWKLDAIPEEDRYDRREAERDVERMKTLRSKIVAKAEALVGDEKGNIALTTTQLAEFFGL